MLEARNLTKTYSSIEAVRGLSFDVKPGTVLGLIGPNGSGKSTTVKILAGLVAPSSGEVFFRGKPITSDLVLYKHSVGYVPEIADLYSYLSGREYLDLVGSLYEIPSLPLERKTARLLDLLSLGSSAGARISSYSKGMRQKILFAASLLNDPALILLDEPLSGMDITSAMVFQHVVKRLALAGKAIVYSSHALEMVEKLCTHVIILRNGHVVADDSVEALRGLMEVPSLSDVFSRLAVDTDTENVAVEIVDAILDKS